MRPYDLNVDCAACSCMRETDIGVIGVGTYPKPYFFPPCY